MAIDFPASPTLNQTFTSGNVNYVWDGTKWTASVTGGIALDQITEGNTKAEVIDTGSDGRFVVTTEGSERLRVDSSGRLGIGTTSPTSALHIDVASGEPFRLRSQTAGSNYFTHVNHAGGDLAYVGAGGGAALNSGTTSDYAIRANQGALLFGTNGNNERARIDSSGRLLVGTSTARSIAAITSQSQIEGTTFNSSSFSLTLNSNDAQSPYLEFAKTRGTSNGSNTVVQSGDQLGYIGFAGADGSDLGQNAAAIAAYVDGTPGTNDMPGRLVFSTTADGASSPTARFQISNNGQGFYFAATGDALEILQGQSAGTTNSILVGRNSSTGIVNGTVSIRIYNNGNIQNTNNSYGSLSDAKLKENIVDATSQWDDLKALQVRKYNFKEETGHETHAQIGLVAQEVELVSPGLVTESPDRDAEGNDLGTVTKSVNYSVLYMKAVKALQEAMERIETLEAKVAALESA